MISTVELQELAGAIVNHQQQIIGELAIEQAKKVPGLKFSSTKSVEFSSSNPDPYSVLSDLTSKFADLFGTTSIEVCKDAIKASKVKIKPEDLPEILR